MKFDALTRTIAWMKRQARHRRGWWERHSLSVVAAALLALWFAGYLLLDPQSVYALARTVFLLMERNGVPGWARADDMERAERLLTQARSIAPGSEVVLNYAVQWLRRMRR